MNKKFCPVPWSYLALKNNGDFRVCCHANTSNEKGLLRKETGSKFNISSDYISEARQSSLMNEVRLSMLKNESHSTCIRCDKEDEAGMNSRRQYEKERAKDVLDFNHALEITNADGSINSEESPVRFMDLRFGNKCNLKCRMCGPTDSEMWYEDHVKLWGEPSFRDGDEYVTLVQGDKGKWSAQSDSYQWVDSEHSWSEIKNHLDDVEYIYIVGGEPLLINGHIDILNECIEKNIASKITLEYNTNLTLLPDEVIKLWNKFKLVRIGISIDGVKDVNDYIRSPSKWGQIEFNLKKLIQNNIDKKFEIWFSLTYQAYNAYHVLSVMDWIKKEFVLSDDVSLRKIHLKTHPLHKPDHLSVKVLPKASKEELVKIYDDYLSKLNSERVNHLDNPRFEKFYAQTEKSLNSFISFMNAEDLSSYLDTFLRMTKNLDQIRTEKIEEVIPQIGKLIYG